MNNLVQHINIFPENSRDLLLNISRDYQFRLVVKNERISKLGDYRAPHGNSLPMISVNKDKNSFRILITFLHELAHHIVWLEAGRLKNPHGAKWKKRFSQLLDIFLQSGAFPEPLQNAVGRHILNPKASTHADTGLLAALRYFDENSQTLLSEIPENQLFKLSNGRIYRKGKLRRTRVLCLEMGSRRKYLIHSLTEVTTIE